ncbi:MAG: cytochrome c biogenesis protein CcsA [Deltaproteobacteria bacterium]|nr:cytochrome c biogenesis protein CcsA [Deltaproteobacteria bacterium]
MSVAPQVVGDPPRRGGIPIAVDALVAGIVLAGVVVALALTFFVAPRETEMGEVQRIFYMHVASAFACLVLFVTCSVASLAYLIMRAIPSQRVLARGVDRLAHAAGEVSVVFGIVVLVTGPLWAKPAWGTYWTWEPRLTLMLLTVFLFIGYVVLRSYARADDAGRRLAAGVAVIAGPAVYLIHVAVELWGGNHPQVVTGQGQGLESGPMALTFAVSVAAVVLFSAYLVWMRMRHHKTAAELETAYLDLSDLEDQRPR